MNGLLQFWRSTIGKKVVMAVTGIIGILFVLGHMTGNLLMFKGQGAMHDYALLLRTSMPLLWAVRLALLAAVVLHAVAAYQLTMLARAARPKDYAQRRPQVTTFAARTIRIGGVIILAFIVYHILHMTLGTVHPDFTHLDPYNNVRIGLANPLVAGFYILATLAVGLHLYHGAWSAVRSLGAARPSTQPLKRKIALLVAVIVAIGFVVIPIAALVGAFEPAPPLAEPVGTTVMAPDSAAALTSTSGAPR
jgi:succinate dehydrogenase / fumarate reductase, cytochrome b subunit